MKRKLIMYASLFGALGVALGAMGAHFLKVRISSESLQAFETAVKYQMYHVLALLALAVLAEESQIRWWKMAGNLFIAGIVLFSGSLYFLSTKSLMGIEEDQLRWVGAITPFGGLAFIGAWLLLFWAGLKQKG